MYASTEAISLNYQTFIVAAEHRGLVASVLVNNRASTVGFNATSSVQSTIDWGSGWMQFLGQVGIMNDFHDV